MVMLSHDAAGWKIRPHTREDAEAIERVFRETFVEFPWRATREARDTDRLRYLLQTSTVLVAEEDNAGVVGFLILQAEAAYVSHVFVAPDWRFCGIAAGLLKVGRSISGQRLRLDVDVDNEQAISAYTQLGWKETVDHGRAGVGQVRFIGP